MFIDKFKIILCIITIIYIYIKINNKGLKKLLKSNGLGFTLSF